jgi:hypothetical protein
MPLPLRDVWTNALRPEDYETHMAAIGQAQANAAHIRDFALLCPPGARVLIAGAGTGQMFDTIPPDVFGHLRAVFTDINPRFLACLRARHPQAVCVADDLELSSLRGPFHAACAVLVLEHIDWQKGLDSLAALSPERLFLVVQRNPPEIATAVSPSRQLPGTMQAFAETHPELRDPSEVTAHLRTRGYALVEEWPRPVADNKIMLGLLYSRAGS